VCSLDPVPGDLEAQREAATLTGLRRGGGPGWQHFPIATEVMEGRPMACPDWLVNLVACHPFLATMTVFIGTESGRFGI